MNDDDNRYSHKREKKKGVHKVKTNNFFFYINCSSHNV